MDAKENSPVCSPECAEFIRNTPLEQLVFLKLKESFDRMNADLPEDILEVILAHVERPLFTLVLQKTMGNQSKAAKVLGCNRNTLHRKLKEHAIAPMELRRLLKQKGQEAIIEALFGHNSQTPPPSNAT